MTSPHADVTDRPTALFDFIMLDITGALLMQDMTMMPIPMNLAMRREKHCVVSRGNEARHICGETSAEGSEDQAQFAVLWMTGLALIASIEEEKVRLYAGIYQESGV